MEKDLEFLVASLEDELFSEREACRDAIHAAEREVENLYRLLAMEDWRPIKTAPTDGTRVVVWAAEREGLPAFVTTAAYHEDAGWCVCEIRNVTHWKPLQGPK